MGVVRRWRREAASAVVVRARVHLNNVPSCPHGSLSTREVAEKGFTGREIIDFSASCNPLGAAPGVLSAMRGVDPSRYPDDEAVELRRALAGVLGVPLEWIVVGNGSVELMWLLAMACLGAGDRALVVGPTFGEYARACRVVGAGVEETRASEEDGFRVDPAAVCRALERARPKLAFLCNPNNPTGRMLPTSEVARLLESCRQTLLVVDEAYLPFCESPPDLRPLLSSGRLLLLRSMTKDHGLAGVRLGYAVAPPEIVGWLRRVRPPWNVNAVAQKAGLAALRDVAHVDEARRVVAESRRYLAGQLSALGLTVVPSVANFLLVRVGHGASFRDALLARGVCVRDCASFGLPAYVRIGIRTMPECETLVDAVRKVLAHG